MFHGNCERLRGSPYLPPTFLEGLNKCLAYKVLQKKRRRRSFPRLAETKACNLLLRVPVCCADDQDWALQIYDQRFRVASGRRPVEHV